MKLLIIFIFFAFCIIFTFHLLYYLSPFHILVSFSPFPYFVSFSYFEHFVSFSPFHIFVSFHIFTFYVIFHIPIKVGFQCQHLHPLPAPLFSPIPNRSGSHLAYRLDLYPHYWTQNNLKEL